MRSHAKASSVGLNSGKGESHQSRHRCAVALVFALLAAACLLPGSALAAETRVPVESFGPDGTPGTTFAFGSAFVAPLAFDQSGERLYALDQGTAKIHGFDATSPGTHTPAGGNFPLAATGSSASSLDDLSTDSVSGKIYFLGEATRSLFGFDSAGTPLGGNFPLADFVDPCGATVDFSGNVWVGDYGAEQIREYDSSGSLIGSVDTSALGPPCRVAVDSESNLYFAFFEGAVWKYTATSGYTDAIEIDPSPTAALAVDPASDDLYVVHTGQVSVYGSDGAPLYEFGGALPGAEYLGIALDQASGEVYASDRGSGQIQVFGPPIPLPSATTEDASEVTTTTATLNATVNPSGKQLTDCHFEYGTTSAYGETAPCVPDAASFPEDSSPHAVSADVSGLNPGTTYHFRLVVASSDGSVNGADRTLTTAIGPPVVSAQAAEAVGLADALLSAKVNPKGARTTYRVEYGTTAAYGQSTPESTPIGFGGDDSAHTVHVHIGGLNPGTAYHFRFVADSIVGTGEGTDATFATYPEPPTFGPCANDPFRSGPGARLSDCRAYEQATPIDKHGANAQGSIKLIQASSAGDRVTFFTNGGLPTSGGSSSLAPFMASRGPAGWSSDGLLAATVPNRHSKVVGWSDDLSTSVVTAPGAGDVGAALFLRDSETAAFELGVAGPTSILEGSYLAGFAADTSHLIFESAASLVPGAPPSNNKLYDLDHGTLTLAGRVPAGSATSCNDKAGPACVPAPDGSFAGPYDWENFGAGSGGASSSLYTENTISRDGSRVFFTTRNSAQLYVREDGTRTTQVSASQAAVPDPNGHKPAAFLAATPDGSKVFFASCEKLTDDSTAVSTAANTCTTADQGQDLYSYDVDSGELTDLTVDTEVGDAKGAAVQGILGTSDDGSYVYFAANGVLAPGATPGTCAGFSGIGRSCNIYVLHNGVVTFVVTLPGGAPDEAGSANWVPADGHSGTGSVKVSRVAADSGTLLFSSRESLTGYANAGKVEFFRYSAPDKELTCVSCNPTGTPASGSAALGSISVFFVDPLRMTFHTRNLSADGNRVFFDSPDALLPTDTNGVNDVYEWEAEGSGSCHIAGGCIYLLSTGVSPDRSFFADASADGDHAFVFTSQQLVPSDRDQLFDVYDAGVGAGLSSQHQLAAPTCTGTACQDNPAPQPDQAAGSAVYSGPGNVNERPPARKCAKSQRRVRHGGKVRCQKKRQSKQHPQHHGQKQANTNRGGSK